MRIIINDVSRGSNPWGCTDYLNNRDKILKTGVTVYELMNKYAVHTKTVLIDDDISIAGSLYKEKKLTKKKKRMYSFMKIFIRPLRNLL